MVGKDRQGHNRHQFGSIARIGTHKSAIRKLARNGVGDITPRKSARLETKSWMLARLSLPT